MASITQRIEPLNNHNYQNWEIRMRAILCLNDLLELIDGSSPQPADNAPDAANWHELNQKALNTIVLALENDQLRHVRGCKTAKEAWDNLAKVHQPRDLVSKLKLRRKLYTTIKDPHTSMEDHIAYLRNIASQLTAVNMPITDDEMVLIILGSLPRDYDDLIFAFESCIDTLDVVTVSNRLILADACRKKRILEDKTLMTEAKLVTRAKKRKLMARCCYCRRKGHYEQHCYKKLRNELIIKACLVRDSCIDSVNDTCLF
jgi:hypothetical protein